MRDRYYSSELHRFLSLDKDQGDLYRPSTLNPYAYVGNDPINFIDPSGMTAVNIANALKNTIFNEDGSLNWGGLFELGKFALSFTPIGWAIDLYDLGKSILEFDWTWGGLADIGLNVVGLIPGIGDLAKGSRLGKNAIKTVDAVADVTDGFNDARKAIKRTDALVDASKAAKNVGNGADAFADSSKAAKTLNKGSDALDAANDARKALKNADETTKNIDFYVGPKGKVLESKYSNWIGDSQRNNLLNSVQNDKLKSAVDEIYRKGAFIGKGGTADVYRFENATGILVTKRGHKQKVTDSINRLNRIVKNNNLSASDSKIVDSILKDLDAALRRK